MRIMHIFDLHFGKHQPLLVNSLKERVAALKTDLVVCSGDVADDTKPELTEDARMLLDELATLCTGNTEPRLIVVPGNHDMRKSGWLYKSLVNGYAKAFGERETDHYYEAENVWVFGFDSAQQGKAGGSGYITDEDLARFHARYDTLSNHPGFAQAFKIVVVHHHPLPVNWDHDGSDRWLTMTNAGKFLSAVLFRKIDLVLHGHEHLQARARLWSTLGANVPEPHNVTDDDRDRTMRVFERVFSTEAVVTTNARTDNRISPLVVSTPSASRRSSK
jgi:3',5'-cyclic AMP phosphodiesterase CpdA